MLDRKVGCAILGNGSCRRLRGGSFTDTQTLDEQRRNGIPVGLRRMYCGHRRAVDQLLIAIVHADDVCDCCVGAVDTR
jgi:hypothetical protein